MKRFWSTSILLVTLITWINAASVVVRKGEASKNCLDEANCSGTEKTLTKRNVASITLDNVAACNKTREICMNKCRGSYACIKDCPVCPEVHIVEGLRRFIVEGENESFIRDTPIIKGANITTIIKLLNLVNNTNLIDIPTNVNLTNQNHVHVYQNDSSEEGGEYGMGYNRFGSCCIVVEPRSCNPTSRGYSCHHKRHKTCGQQCTSRIIHAERRQKCTTGKSCMHKVSYVPQPKKPTCSYISTWPFVLCGAHRQQKCHGCYQHYGRGAHSYYGGKVPSRCHACYDDAFHIGPMYRRGPVLKPFYYHQPPCYLTGTCGSMCNMNGCYGHQFVDPSWGYMGQPQYQGPQNFPQMFPQNFPQHFPQHFSGYYPSPDEQFDPQDIPFSIDSKDSSIEGGDGTEFTEIEDNLPHIPSDGADWGVELHKCRVVDNNGTVSIKNCTDTEWERNPFASSPSVYPSRPVEAYENADSYGFDGELEDYIRYPPPSAYEGYERTPWDDSVAGNPRNLRRRHTKPQRKHSIVYDE